MMLMIRKMMNENPHFKKEDIEKAKNDIGDNRYKNNLIDDAEKEFLEESLKCDYGSIPLKPKYNNKPQIKRKYDRRKTDHKK